jgi:hypothetical protein
VVKHGKTVVKHGKTVAKGAVKAGKKLAPLVILAEDVPLDATKPQQEGIRYTAFGTPLPPLTRISDPSTQASSKSGLVKINTLPEVKIDGVLLPTMTRISSHPTTTSGKATTLNCHGRKHHWEREKEEERGMMKPFIELKDLKYKSSLEAPLLSAATKKDRENLAFVKTTTGMQSPLITRLATQMEFRDSLPSREMAKFIATGASDFHLGKHKSEKHRTALEHIKHSHKVFYHLLKQHELLDTIDTTENLAVIIPHQTSLEALDATADHTETLKYHLVISAEPLQSMEEMTEVVTLNGQVVQVEYRRDCQVHLINGQLFRTDVNEMYENQIYHVSQVMEPGHLAPMTEEENPLVEEVSSVGETDSGTGEGEESSGNSEASGESSEEEEEMKSRISLPFTASPLLAATKERQYKNVLLGEVVGKMALRHFSNTLDLKAYTSTSKQTTGAGVTLRTYPTQQLYGDYNKDAMREVSRLRAEKSFALQPTDSHYQLGADALYSHYKPLDRTIHRSQLRNHLLEVSIGGQLFITHLACHECDMADEAAYASEDEWLLARFTKDNYLSEVLLKNSGPVTTEEKSCHCLEVALLNEKNKELFARRHSLTHQQFNERLLMVGDPVKYLRKKTKGVRKAAGKVARKVHAKGKRFGKSKSAARTFTVPVSVLGLDALEAQESDSSRQTESLTLTAYDGKMKPLTRFTKQEPQAEKYAYEVDGDQLDGYHLVAGNTLGTNMSSGQIKYLKVAMPAQSVTFNLTRAKPSAGTALYAEHDSNLYVLIFDSAGAELERLLMVPKSSNLAIDIKSQRSAGKKKAKRDKKKKHSSK